MQEAREKFLLAAPFNDPASKEIFSREPENLMILSYTIYLQLSFYDLD